MFYTNDKGERVYTLKVRRRWRCMHAQRRGGGRWRCMHASDVGGASRPRGHWPGRADDRAAWHAAGAPSPLPAAATVVAAATLSRFAPAACHAFSPAQKQTPEGAATHSAHPARFSPDDKFRWVLCRMLLQCLAFFVSLLAPSHPPTPTPSPSPCPECSRERITCKRRFSLLPTQQKPLVY